MTPKRNSTPLSRRALAACAASWGSKKVLTSTVSTVAWNRLRHGLDAAVAVSDDAAEGAMRDLAGCDIVSGESGAAALAGLRATLDRVDRSDRQRLGLGPDGRVLLLSTEGITDREGYRRVVGRGCKHAVDRPGCAG